MQSDLLIQKIDELFKFRKIPEMLDRVGINTGKERLWDQLVALQYRIYLLDKYLEENWDLDDLKIKSYWNAIESHDSLSIFSEQEKDKALYPLQVYLARERGMRLGQRLPDIQIRPFYYYKSCDIKLIRCVIYTLYPNLRLFIHPLDWILFDFLTEVSDDLEDVEEDRKNHNGNRYLHSLLAYGPAHTQDEYQSFIDYLSEKLMVKKSVIDDQVVGWTAEILRSVKPLLSATSELKVSR